MLNVTAKMKKKTIMNRNPQAEKRYFNRYVWRCDLGYFRFQNYRNLAVPRKRGQDKTLTVHQHVLTELGECGVGLICLYFVVLWLIKDTNNFEFMGHNTSPEVKL
jgi:hypothetical protein